MMVPSEATGGASKLKVGLIVARLSWKRAIKLCDGNAEAHLMQGDATLQRLAQEIERRKWREWKYLPKAEGEGALACL